MMASWATPIISTFQKGTNIDHRPAMASVLHGQHAMPFSGFEVKIMQANTKPRNRRNTHGKARVKRTSIKGVPALKIIQELPDGELSSEQETELRALVQIAANSNSLIGNRTEAICPKGSILDVVAEIFRKTTDIPLELPICMTMSFIAAHLVARGASILVSGKHVDPFLWMILLANSGGGKTYVEQFISKHISVPTFPQINSAAKFVAELSTCNRSLWLQDEFAQLLKRIQTADHMADLREYLLRTYDKSVIMRSTMKETTVISEPVLTVLGMTVSDTFPENISAEMMLDGTMQRLQVVYADVDPARPMQNFPIYKAHQTRWSRQFARAWAKVATIDLTGTFTLGRGADDEYQIGFRRLVDHMGELPRSFVRRIAWSAMRLSLVYHAILCKNTKIIDREDMRWAMNMTMLHLTDLRRLINSYGVSELAELIKRGEGIRDRFQQRHGRTITRREFAMNLKNVKHHGIMTFIMSVLDIK